MPIYEYRCNSCGSIFEELVPINTGGDSLKCPTCSNVGARRMISAFAAHGLENGHIAVGRKLTGGSNSADSGSDSAPKAPVDSGPA